MASLSVDSSTKPKSKADIANRIAAFRAGQQSSVLGESEGAAPVLTGARVNDDVIAMLHNLEEALRKEDGSDSAPPSELPEAFR
eukprot:CAMPEP_0205823338 /NCGR_PEP_ID=MMETSP0206-20130828/16102_1 /ASSEMBLY_ACC=CAM_ASM_000279 /TAXON_ID=36767 /ORGANISM="Euplotes focardii, Strain TN1" /LENGTH=83 /DNA_ID=CAMNT_0053120401 /DNA_START=57 /DNA_END=308 /DNA_ORIENTATION=+